MSQTLLLDNSAWARLAHPALPSERATTVAQQIEDGRLAACLPFVLEAGYSVRDAGEHDALMEELTSLPWLAIDADVERIAVRAQRQLARMGQHRIPPVDVVTAAVAHHHGAGVLHYDAHFDLLSARTDLRFDSVWLAPRGTL